MMINDGTNFLNLLEKLPDLYSEVDVLKSAIAELKQDSIRSKPYYEVKEIASFLGVHRNTVYNKIKQGEIPAENVFGKHKIPHRYVLEMGLI